MLKPLFLMHNRVNGKIINKLIPSTKCNLNTQASAIIKSAAPVLNVAICCAQFAKATIVNPRVGVSPIYERRHQTSYGNDCWWYFWHYVFNWNAYFAI
jgi:hypothetical protein